MNVLSTSKAGMTAIIFLCYRSMWESFYKVQLDQCVWVHAQFQKKFQMEGFCRKKGAVAQFICLWAQPFCYGSRTNTGFLWIRTRKNYVWSATFNASSPVEFFRWNTILVLLLLLFFQYLNLLKTYTCLQLFCIHLYHEVSACLKCSITWWKYW